MYEQLPNICYWCGLLTHDDKECDVWLNSKGTLSVEEQQFGSWLRAPQFSQAKKLTVEVQGFENVGTNRPIPRRTEDRVLAHHMDMTARVKGDGVEHEEVGNGVTESQPASMTMEVSSSDAAQRDSHVNGTDIGDPRTKIPDFEARIKEIDEAINAEPAVLKSNISNPNPYLAISGKERNIGSNGSTRKILGSPLKSPKKVIADLPSQIYKLSPREVKFEGWDETTATRKNSKSGSKKIKNKAPTSPNKSIGPNIGHVGLQVVSKENPTTEGWVSTHLASTNQGGMEFTHLESDPKRKRDYLKTDSSKVTCMEKKLKLDEKTRSLSILMATHLGSAEAVEQSHRVQ